MQPKARIGRFINPFERFPAEINLSIVEGLEKRDLRSLSRCSKLCYLLCLPLRLDISKITLTHGSIKLFQRGGLCELLGVRVRSVRFENQWDWVNDSTRPSVGTRNIKNEYNNTEEIVTRLRAWTEALDLFPNIREFYVSYMIPIPMENNTFAAIFDAITKQTFYRNLEHLDFQVYRMESRNSSGSPESYESIFSGLSTETKRFLGGDTKISDDKMNKYIGGKVIELVELKSARISVNGLATPFADSQPKFSNGSTYYYIPLTQAPNLRTLQIETSEGETTGPKNKKSDESEPYFESSILNCFSRISELQIVKAGIPSKGEIKRLVERFPALETLEISQLNRCTRDYDGYWPDDEQDHRYDDLMGLKQLEELTIPWPAYHETGSVPPDHMRTWVYKWIEGGLDSLETVCFEGMRRLDEGYRDRWEEITVSMGIEHVGNSARISMQGDKRNSYCEDLVRE